jgi:hypothetical protein
MTTEEIRSLMILNIYLLLKLFLDMGVILEKCEGHIFLMQPFIFYQ